MKEIFEIAGGSVTGRNHLKAGKNNQDAYAMSLLNNSIPLFRYSDRRFRLSSGIDNQAIINLFKQLHELVNQLHQLHIIIGDFNDLNVLVSQNQVYLIDTDSYQFKTFLCRVFTTRFVDPMLCNEQANQVMLKENYHINSDWYAFTVMLMQCLLFVDPFGGVYKPKNKSSKIPQSWFFGTYYAKTRN